MYLMKCKLAPSCCKYSYCYVHVFFANVCVLHCINLCYLHTDPPLINRITIDEICINDFSASWSIAGNNTGLSYVIIPPIPPNNMQPTMDTSRNFTGLSPNTNYNISVISKINRDCAGVPTSKMVTTSTMEAGIPSSELTLLIAEYIQAYILMGKFIV